MLNQFLKALEEAVKESPVGECRVVVQSALTLHGIDLPVFFNARELLRALKANVAARELAEFHLYREMLESRELGEARGMRGMSPRLGVPQPYEMRWLRDHYTDAYRAARAAEEE